MVQPKTLLHILEILGVFACAHHFWPKGVTYGEEEEWEKNMKEKEGHHGSKSSKSRSKHSSKSERKRSSRTERDRGRDMDEHDGRKARRGQRERGEYGVSGRERGGHTRENHLRDYGREWEYAYEGSNLGEGRRRDRR